MVLWMISLLFLSLSIFQIKKKNPYIIAYLLI